MVRMEADSDDRNPLLVLSASALRSTAGEFATKNVRVSQRRKIPILGNA